VVKLRKAEGPPVRVSVLVNDEMVQLPAIRAEGDSYGDKIEFTFLDDDRNPLTLSFRIGIGGIKPLSPDAAQVCKSWKGAGSPPSGFLGGGRCEMPNGGDRDTLRVIKISSRCSGPAIKLAGGGAPPAAPMAGSGASALEKALAQQGTVDVYSIYFSFNSDAIRDESQPTLKDIAEVMRKHADWKLRVDGHTDSIGGNEYNLALSKRRSAAVKDVLVKQFGINPARLVTGWISDENRQFQAPGQRKVLNEQSNTNRRARSCIFFPRFYTGRIQTGLLGGSRVPNWGTPDTIQVLCQPE
jgi:outer membrane protein OmpA-like peptidoglycan-associated protein